MERCQADKRPSICKDRLESENIKVEYCPTEFMIADFFTKPLQGSLFRKFRDVIQGYHHMDTIFSKTEDSLSQECVGRKISDVSNNGYNERPSDVEKMDGVESTETNDGRKTKY
eukprot:CAMPEP_0176488928 /NCGR_PEP_ID=MMETSP0200_2-20121128/6990_1 /TAXON_ID=947934 /ORGANISM="Chaetoceros sp., Strain GSL56" /LENGTH=113 /DNA_ID=CAMNT_0017885983 /DNA_START=11 /DNA_END=349 /DNA_ORIENTATION=-